MGLTDKSLMCEKFSSMIGCLLMERVWLLDDVDKMVSGLRANEQERCNVEELLGPAPVFPDIWT